MTGSLRVCVNDIEMRYDEVGSGGRAFVLVHGFTGCRDDFASQLPALAAQGRTLAPDQRGHGDSTNTGDAKTYNLAQLCKDLRGFADALGLERFDLLGHSMGGMVAQRFTLANPERVASLVLMDTASEPLAEGLPREMLEKGAAIARAIGMQGLHEIIRKGAGQNDRRSAPDRRLEQEWGADRYWARVRRGFTSMDVEAFEALGIELGAGEPTKARLCQISCPTTVLVGAMDTPFLAASRTMHQAIRDSQLVVIPDGGHSPQLEAPAAWLTAIEGHLRWARATQGLERES